MYNSNKAWVLLKDLEWERFKYVRRRMRGIDGKEVQACSTHAKWKALGMDGMDLGSLGLKDGMGGLQKATKGMSRRRAQVLQALSNA
jgi:hypothetical protein